MSMLTGFLVFAVLALIVALGGYILGNKAEDDSQKWADERYEESWDEEL